MIIPADLRAVNRGFRPASRVFIDGHVRSNALRSHAVLLDHGHETDLGTLGGWRSYAAAINDNGAIVGSSQIKGNDGRVSTLYHAFLWRGGTMIDLGTLGGKVSQAWALNNRGQVFGWAANRRGIRRAFLWESGKMRDLGPFSIRSKVVALTLRRFHMTSQRVNSRGQALGLQQSAGFFD